MIPSLLVYIQLDPRPHFVVKEWGLADSFDDFLSEKTDLECATEFVEQEGAFVAMRFFPLSPIGIDQMELLRQQFLKENDASKEN